MVDAVARLAEVRTSSSALLAGLEAERWSDSDVREPSVLPGWTRGHVLTHIARNGDACARTFAGTLRGEIAARYPDGVEGRAADIEAGADRGATDLIADVRDSIDRLDRVCAALTEASGWNKPADGDRPAGSWLNSRWREVEIHRADLDGAYHASDWPAGFIGYLLPRMATEVGERTEQPLRIEVSRDGSTTTDLGGTVWTSGREGETVSGPDWALLAWLVGRPSLTEGRLNALPELAQWS